MEFSTAASLSRCQEKKREHFKGCELLRITLTFVYMLIGLWLLDEKPPGDGHVVINSFPWHQWLFDSLLRAKKSLLWKLGLWKLNRSVIENDHMQSGVTVKEDDLFKCLLFVPFFGRPLPLPSRDFLSISLLLGLVGAAGFPLIDSPLSLRESPLPESLDEFFLSLRLAFALRRASWMLLLDEDTQLPLISLLMFLLEVTTPPLSSSPDTKESLRSSVSDGLQGTEFGLDIRSEGQDCTASIRPKTHGWAY